MAIVIMAPRFRGQRRWNHDQTRPPSGTTPASPLTRLRQTRRRLRILRIEKCLTPSRPTRTTSHNNGWTRRTRTFHGVVVKVIRSWRRYCLPTTDPRSTTSIPPPPRTPLPPRPAARRPFAARVRRRQRANARATTPVPTRPRSARRMPRWRRIGRLAGRRCRSLASAPGQRQSSCS